MCNCGQVGAGQRAGNRIVGQLLTCIVGGKKRSRAAAVHPPLFDVTIILQKRYSLNRAALVLSLSCGRWMIVMSEGDLPERV